VLAPEIVVVSAVFHPTGLCKYCKDIVKFGGPGKKETDVVKENVFTNRLLKVHRCCHCYKLILP